MRESKLSITDHYAIFESIIAAESERAGDSFALDRALADITKDGMPLAGQTWGATTPPSSGTR